MFHTTSVKERFFVSTLCWTFQFVQIRAEHVYISLHTYHIVFRSTLAVKPYMHQAEAMRLRLRHSYIVRLSCSLVCSTATSQTLSQFLFTFPQDDKPENRRCGNCGPHRQDNKHREYTAESCAAFSTVTESDDVALQ
jgi:hypothetical protein